MVEPAQVGLDLDELTSLELCSHGGPSCFLLFTYLLIGKKNLNDSVKFGIFYKTNFAP